MCCDDDAVHTHDVGQTFCRNGVPYSFRYQFQWRKPYFVWYRIANSYGIKFRLHRYPGIVVGAGLLVGHWAIGVAWGKPGQRIELDISA